MTYHQMVAFMKEEPSSSRVVWRSWLDTFTGIDDASWQEAIAPYPLDALHQDMSYIEGYIQAAIGQINVEATEAPTAIDDASIARGGSQKHSNNVKQDRKRPAAISRISS
jgi:hypothetical protein